MDSMGLGMHISFPVLPPKTPRIHTSVDLNAQPTPFTDALTDLGVVSLVAEEPLPIGEETPL